MMSYRLGGESNEGGLGGGSNEGGLSLFTRNMRILRTFNHMQIIKC